MHQNASDHQEIPNLPGVVPSGPNGPTRVHLGIIRNDFELIRNSAEKMCIGPAWGYPWNFWVLLVIRSIWVHGINLTGFQMDLESFPYIFRNLETDPLGSSHIAHRMTKQQVHVGAIPPLIRVMVS